MSSQDVIAAELAAGTIDTATSLEYRAWALFGDPRLPAKYDGAGSGGEDAALFDDIAASLESLPADKRDELSRYLLRPTDPQSPFSSAPPAARGNGIALAAFAQAETPASDQCEAAGRHWFHADWPLDESQNQGFRVWACGPSQTTVKDYLEKVLTIGSDLWPKMTAAEPNGMGLPVSDLGAQQSDGNGKTDVYLLDPLADCRQRGDACQPIPGDAVAAAPKDFPANCGVSGFPANGCSGYLLLGKDRIDKPSFAADFAHEFFHVLQHAHNGQIKLTWYHEASAVWAEWFYEREPAKPEADSEFRKYQAEDRSLLWYDYSALYQYRAWGWPLFQSLEAGPENVFQTWSAIEAADSREDVDGAIDGQLEFATAFRDFAARNAQPPPYIPPASNGLEDDRWQTNPDLADFPTDEHLITAQRSQVQLGSSSHSVEIQPLAAQYDEFEILDSDIHEINIDISQLQNAGQADLDVLGQLSGADTWHRFRASGSKLKLCREKAEQNVTYMELVISNHLAARSSGGSDFPDFGKMVKGQYTIEAKDKCEEQDVLLHGTFTGHHDGVLDSTDASFDLTIVWHRPDNPNDVLNFEFVSGSFTFDTQIIGVCAGSLSESEPLTLSPTGSQGLNYGDPTQIPARYASAQIADQRLDYARIAIFLDAHFDVPNGSDECQPPFQPAGDIAGCPLLFPTRPDGTLETESTCADNVGTTWTGHLAGQQ
jgi:hypothetical protein